MKYSKRYIAFTGVLAVALLIKFNNFGEQYQTVNRFRGAQLEETTWNPLIAQSVNDGLLSVVIDNKEYTNEKYPFFMDANLDIMVPVSILRDALNCSAHIYNEDTLLVEKHNSELSFSLNNDVIDVNGKKEKVVSPLIRKNKEYYVSLNDLSNYLDYSYTWNIQENKAQAADVSESATIIPKSTICGTEGFCYPQSGNVWNLLVFCSVECDGIRSFTGAGLSVFGGSYDIE